MEPSTAIFRRSLVGSLEPRSDLEEIEETAMFDLPVLVLTLLLSVDPDQLWLSHLSSAPQAPAGVEITQRTDVRVPWAERTQTWTSAPVMVTMDDVLARAEQRLAAEALAAQSETPPDKRKGRIPGILPAHIVDLMQLQAYALPPSDRIDVADPTEALQKSLSSIVNVNAIDASNSNSVPPDPELAVSDAFAIAVVNTDYQIYLSGNGGAVTSVFNLTDLLGSNSDCDSGLFDPNIVYDEEADRFLMGADANGTDYCLGVSTSNNPLLTWVVYSFPTDIGGAFFDYPHLGVGRQALYMGSNQFVNGSFEESRLFAIDRVAVYLQQPTTAVSWSLDGFTDFAFTPQPLSLHGDSDGSWPTSGPDYFLTGQGNVNKVNIWSIDDPFGSGTLVQQDELHLTNYTGVSVGTPVDPPQSGSTDSIDGGDWRPLDFEYRNGYGWVVQNLSCNPGSGTVNCIRWAQLDPAANSIVDAGVYSPGNSLYTLHPDLAVNRCNDMMVGFSISSSSQFPGAYVAGRESDDTAGELSNLTTMQAGVITYRSFDGDPLRWGDYTGATIAPDGLGLWYLGEYSGVVSGSKNWVTRMAHYEFPDSDNDDVPDSCDACPGSNDASDSDGDGVPNGCDTCAGSDDSADADNDGVPDGCDECEGDDDSEDSDNDGVCNDIDLCEGSDDSADADGDDVPDGCDVCAGSDDSVDTDSDDVPDGCDVCEGSDDSIDTDNDDVPDGCDVCEGSDDSIDTDSDGVPDGCDICEGSDDSADADGDGVPNGCDVCAGSDDSVDTDNDGVPDGCDICQGSDDSVDSDSDGVPDGCDICEGSDDSADADGDDVPNGCDVCAGSDDSVDSDSDGVPDGCDICEGSDDSVDSDSDGVPDGCDICQGSDDTVDSDSDGVPDGCDICQGSDDTVDSDSDGVPDGCDICQGSDDAVDSDSDGVPDGCDICEGSDDAVDSDFDGVPDGCDICQGSNDTIDSDFDGVPDGCDICQGSDDSVDSDFDGVPDGCDICQGSDDSVDSDFDGVPDGCDICQGSDDTVDSDNDGVPDGCDDCTGNDSTGDVDGDDICADLDCNDDDATNACEVFADGFESGNTSAWDQS